MINSPPIELHPKIKEPLRFVPQPDLDWPVLQTGSLSRLIDILGSRNITDHLGLNPEKRSLNHLNNIFLLSQIVLKTIMLEYGYRTNNPYGTKYDQSLLTIANYLPKLIAEKKYQPADLHELSTDLDRLLSNFEIPRQFSQIFSAPDGSQPNQALTITERVIQLLWQVSPDNSVPTDLPAYQQRIESQLKIIFKLVNTNLTNIQLNVLPPTPYDHYQTFIKDPYLLSLRKQWADKRKSPGSVAKRKEDSITRALQSRQIINRILSQQESREILEKRLHNRQIEYQRERNKSLAKRNRMLKEILPGTRKVKDIASKLATIGEISMLLKSISSLASAKELQRLAQTFRNYCANAINSDPVRQNKLTKPQSLDIIANVVNKLWSSHSVEAKQLLSDLANAAFIELDLINAHNPKASQTEDSIASSLATHEQISSENKKEVSLLEQSAITYLGLDTPSLPPQYPA